MTEVSIEPEVLQRQAAALEARVNELVLGKKTPETGGEYVRINRRLSELYSQLEDGARGDAARQRVKYAHALFGIDTPVLIGDLKGVAYGLGA